MWKRNCPNPDSNPNCEEKISYTWKKSRDYAEKRNSKCGSCAQKGKNHPFYGKTRSEKVRKRISESNKGQKRSEETKEKMRKNHFDVSGKNHPMYGKCGENNPNFGSKRSEETRKNMRLSAIKRIEKQNGQIMPNSNPKATQIIRAKAKELGITDLQDAETPGGEYQVCGYFVDGRSKEKNTVIEYYEKHHKYQTERDKRRKREIINELGCQFIEIKEWEMAKQL